MSEYGVEHYVASGVCGALLVMLLYSREGEVPTPEVVRDMRVSCVCRVCRACVEERWKENPAGYMRCVCVVREGEQKRRRRGKQNKNIEEKEKKKKGKRKRQGSRGNGR